MKLHQQIFHILKKDIRAHWSEIASVALLNVLLILTSTANWSTAVTRASSPFSGIPTGTIATLSALLLALAWLLMITRVVQAESPASHAQQWLTRPYSRAGLLLSKVLFIVIFVHALTMLSHLIIVAASGIPFRLQDLIFNQLTFVALISLPAATIAALTRSLRGFLLAAIPLVAIVLGLIVLRGPMPVSMLIFNDELYYYDLPSALDGWLRVLASLIGLILIAVPALYLQFRLRRTRHIASASAAGIAVLALIVYMSPRSLTASIEAALTGTSVDMPAVIVELPGPNEALDYIPSPFNVAERIERNPEDWENIIDLPVLVEYSGANPIQTQLVNARIRLLSQSGETASVYGMVRDDLTWATVSRRWLRFAVPTDFYRQFSEQDVAITIDLDVKQYVWQDLEPIPTDGSYVIVDQSEQCGLGEYSYIFCRAAFRGSTRWDSFYLPERTTTSAALIREFVSIPLSINPISRHEFRTSGNIGNALSGAPVLLVTPEGFEHRRLEVDGVRLADWTIPSLVAATTR